MNVCFLDFDGVFTLTGACYLLGDYVDHAAVKILNKFLVDNEFKIVVSSTWRKGSTALELSSYLNLSGFNRGLLFYDDFKTKSLSGLRGEEIAEWLSRHPEVQCYIIVDDDDDMLPEQLDNFIHVDAANGFAVRDYHRALSVASSTKLIDDDTCDPLVRPFKPRGVGRGINTYYENYIKNKGKDIE